MARTLSPLNPTVPEPSPGRRLRWPRRIAVAAAGGVVGGVIGRMMPLGPTATGQALLVMASALLLGFAGARILRSGWRAVVLVGVGYVGGVELARWAVDLPTVDAIRLDSVYGALAFVAGRGVHGLLLAVPLVLGARLAGAARLRHRVRARTATGLAALLSIALVAAVAWPASTPPVRGPDGGIVPGSLAALETVTLGGDEHAVMIRGADPSRPVLLYLSGGPGQSDLALSRVLSEPWLDQVVFATFDQRGNGKSYGALLPTDAATLDRAVDDVIELTEHLRARFGQQRILLMGESWGTILGVLAVQERPDLFRAYLGSGQMVDVRETDRAIYHDLVAYAARTRDDALTATLRAMGEPPYADVPWSNAAVMGAYGHLYGPFTPSPGYLARGEASGLDPFGLLGSEYTVLEKANVLRGLVDTFAVMYPQLQGLDLRRDVPRLDVPVYLLDGAAELRGRREPALEWFARLDAPHKRIVTFAGAAHAVAYEQADEVDRLLAEEILPQTQP